MKRKTCGILAYMGYTTIEEQQMPRTTQRTTLRSSTKPERMNFRLGREHKILIEKAASTVGQSLTEFAVTNLIRDARAVLHEHHVTVLSERDWGIFLSVLDTDAEPNEALKKAASTYRRQRA
jgi:uncharacterized protein (DUF1778 family)